MKKTALLLALALIASMLFPCAFAASNSGKCGASINWSYNSSSKTLTLSGSGRMYDYTDNSLPPWSSKTINTVTVTGDVTYIGSNAFYKLGATSYTLPDTVLELGSGAFYYNGKLEYINLPKRLEIIGECAFQGCGLKSLTLPDRVETIDRYAFMHCNRMTSITLPASLKTIGMDAFYNAWYLESIDLPEGLETIGYCAFGFCHTLSQITIPASVTSFSEGALWFCDTLASIDVAPGSTILKSVDGVLFNKAGTKLIQYPRAKQTENYVVPSGVSELTMGAFKGNKSLKTVKLPAGISSLPASAFAECTELTHAELPEGLADIGNYAFDSCSALTELTLPEGVTAIGDKAFQNSGIQRLTVPQTLTTFGSDVFLDCPGPITLCMIAGSPAAAYAQQQNLNIEYLFPSDQVDLVLPADLEVIEDSAFAGTDAAVAILPDRVTRIGSRAFAACPKLKHVFVPDGVAEIASDAFDGANGLYLYGKAGSSAQDYAKDHAGVDFIPLNHP